MSNNDNPRLAVVVIIATVFALADSRILTKLKLPLDISSEQEFLFGAWSALGVTELIAIVVLAVAISVGAAYAYQNGRPSTIATFDFAYIAFAMMWGILVFGEEPTYRGVAGASLIVIAGILSVRSGKRWAQPAEQSAAVDATCSGRS